MSDSQLNTIPDEIQERWLPVPDFPGYEVSDRGRVRSFWGRASRGLNQGAKSVLKPQPQRILKGGIGHGYRRVVLRKNGRNYCFMIYTLVLLAFVGPCPLGLEACHEDGTRSNDSLTNLRWDTRSANSQDSIRYGSHIGLTQKGSEHFQAKLTDQQVFEIRELYAQGRLQKDIARMFNASKGCIYAIVKRINWNHLP